MKQVNTGNAKGYQAGRDINLKNINFNFPSNWFSSVAEPIKNAFNLNKQNKYKLNTPIIPDDIILREDKINKLLEEVHNNKIIYIKGIKFSGKTYISLLLAEKMKKDIIWISCKDSKDDNNFIKNMISEIFERKIKNDEIRNFCNSNLKKILNKVIVLDNFQSLNAAEVDPLVELFRLCIDNNIQIIINSLHEIPHKLKLQIGYKNFFEIKDLTVTNSEIIEFFKKHNRGDSDYDEKFNNFIIGFASGDIALINSLFSLHYSRNFKSEIFDRLVNGNYGKNIKDELYNIFIKENDEITKSLFYRMDILNGEIDAKAINVISEVEPKINFPFEIIEKLKNIWLVSENEKFKIMPSLKGIGKKNILENQLIEINKRMADLILEKQVLNEKDVFELLTYLLNAKEYNRLGGIFSQYLLEFIKCKEAEEVYDVSEFWKGLPLPKQISVDIRIGIRVLQLQILKRKNKSIDFILRELEDIIDRNISLNYLSYIMVTHTFVSIGNLKNKKAFYKYYLKALPFSDTEKNIVDLKYTIHDGFWINSCYIDNEEEINDFISYLKKIPISDFKILFLNEEIYEHLSLIFSKLWINKSKEYITKNKSKIYRILDSFIKIADEKETSILKTMAVETKIIISGDFLDKLDICEKIGLDYIDENIIESKEKYIIYDIIANQYYYKKRYIESIKWFDKAFEFKEPSTYSKVNSLLKRSVSEVEFNKENAYSIIKNLYDNIDNFSNRLDLQLLIYGEFIIQTYNNKTDKEAFYPLEKALKLIWRERENLDYVKESIVLIAHLLGYLNSICRHNSPPPKLKDDQEYCFPVSGAFLSATKEVRDFYDKSKLVTMISLLILYADTVREDSIIEEWIEALLEEPKDKLSFPIFSTYFFTYYLIREEYEKAINIQIEYLKFVSDIKLNKNIGIQIVAPLIISFYLSYFKNNKILFEDYLSKIIEILQGKENRNISESILYELNGFRKSELELTMIKENKNAYIILIKNFEYLISSEVKPEYIIECIEKTESFLLNTYNAYCGYMYRNLILEFFIAYIKINFNKLYPYLNDMNLFLIKFNEEDKNRNENTLKNLKELLNL